MVASLMQALSAIEGASPISPQIEPLFVTYSDLFVPPTALPSPRSTNYRITLLPSIQPVNVRPYRYAHAQKAEMERQVVDMLAADIICPNSSPFSSFALLAHKVDDTWPFCVDYRALNMVTVKFPFPILVIDEFLDELRGATIFSKLDFHSGFHQIRMYLPDVPKTAFCIHEGHLEFLVMPFGLCNAPSTFQALMNSNLVSVFEVLRANDLKVKAFKCTFGQTTVAYLGHLILAAGVTVDFEKVQCILGWP